MTDFDYEILEAVAKYGEIGATQAELESGKLKGYNIGYNLKMLSYREPLDVGKIKIVTANDAVLLEKEECKKVIGNMVKLSVYRYFITPRGQAMLNNWKMCNRKRDNNHHRECFFYAMFGAMMGVILNFIFSIAIECLPPNILPVLQQLLLSLTGCQL